MIALALGVAAGAIRAVLAFAVTIRACNGIFGGGGAEPS